jgi:hypothetical protein
VGGWGAAARTCEGQRGEGRVVLERGGQLPLVADLIACGTRGARTMWAQRARAAEGSGGAAKKERARLHALRRSSVVRVVLLLSAAASNDEASSLTPSSPI